MLLVLQATVHDELLASCGKNKTCMTVWLKRAASVAVALFTGLYMKLLACKAAEATTRPEGETEASKLVADEEPYTRACHGPALQVMKRSVGDSDASEGQGPK